MSKNLEVRKVETFAGVEFHIPAYQRGYRWRKPQTEQLLRDIDDARLSARAGSAQPYLLQPIVLKRLSEGGESPEKFEVIDGQQRLTTIWIILQYFRNGGWRKPGKYGLVYDTREEESAFLETREVPGFLDRLGTEQQNPVRRMDEDFFVKSYEAVKSYFEKIKEDEHLDDDAFSDYIVAFCQYLQKSVEVIWYEVESELSDRDGEEIFMSLNRGRIPLESSELIKTLLLVKASRSWEGLREDTERQTEIAAEWDEMERSFAEPEFWAFIGGNDGESVGKPRMGYLLEMLPPPSGGEWDDQEWDDYRVFNRYENMIRTYDKESDAQNRSLDVYVLEEIWRNHIRAKYLQLKDWSKDVRLFHKIGFLISVKRGSQKNRMALLRELLEYGGLKSELESVVDGKITEVFQTTRKIQDLDYQKDYEGIYRLLLLFNVLSCMKEAEHSDAMSCEWYSFARHEAEEWSLEHINPQKELTISGSGDRVVWKDWLERQRPFLKLAQPEGAQLASETDVILQDIEQLDEAKFKNLSDRIVAAFSTDFDYAGENGIGNLALLSRRDNSSIGASIFLGKRQEILEKISNGRFVPFCTRRVFLKHYTMLRADQDARPEEYGLTFWTTVDAKNYADQISATVSSYLSNVAQTDGSTAEA